MLHISHCFLRRGYTTVYIYIYWIQTRNVGDFIAVLCFVPEPKISLMITFRELSNGRIV